VQLTIDVNEKLVVATYSGEINDAEILDLVSQIRFHPDFHSSFSLIVDFSGVTDGTISTLAVQARSRQGSILSPASKRVIVAPQAHIFGLARMFEGLVEQGRPNLVVVGTVDEARKVLGLKETG